MARFYPFAMTIDGRRYTGDWSLQLGGTICIRSAWGSETVEFGSRRPEKVAQEALERIVAAYHACRADERDRQTREGRRLAESARALSARIASDADPAIEALRDLIQQIKDSGFRDKHGHPIENLEAYIEAAELVRGYGGR